jgi:alanine dehydrogenase
MKVGVPTEVKTDEYRVAATPVAVRELHDHGPEVLIQSGAGEGSTIYDSEYEAVGATIVPTAVDVFAGADLVLKVKEPQPEEFALLRAGHILFTYLHLAAYPDVAAALQDREVVAFGYETVQLEDGRLPLLAPMSEIAGRMAPQVGAHFLERASGGRGILLGGVSGTRPAKVVVLGAGMAGSNAAWIAQGMEAEVILIDRDINKLRYVDQVHKGRIVTLASSRLAIEQELLTADLVIGAVLVAGGRAPVVVTEDMVRAMRRGAVLVDISIDQGGCFETSRETTHSDPTYVVHDVVHYCVGNIPGAVPHTSTYALANATMPYAVALADEGPRAAVARHPELALGLNVARGKIVNPAVAAALRAPAAALADVL